MLIKILYQRIIFPFDEKIEELEIDFDNKAKSDIKHLKGCCKGRIVDSYFVNWLESTDLKIEFRYKTRQDENGNQQWIFKNIYIGENNV